MLSKLGGRKYIQGNSLHPRVKSIYTLYMLYAVHVEYKRSLLTLPYMLDFKLLLDV